MTVDEEKQLAYVSGGSTHSNQFCAPLNSVESYDLVNNDWVEIAPLQQARTGKTAVKVQGHLVVLGGTQQIRNMCNETSISSVPSAMQTPVYEIEVYDNGKWDVVDHLSHYRFRSTSIAYNDKVYSFGGQHVYFSLCKCHPTVDDVVVYDRDTSGDYDTGFVGGFESDQGSMGWEDEQADEAEPESEEWGDSVEHSSSGENESGGDKKHPFGYGNYNRDGLKESRSVAESSSVNFLMALTVGSLAVLLL